VIAQPSSEAASGDVPVIEPESGVVPAGEGSDKDPSGVDES